MMRVLIDSDVILDYFLNRMPFADDSEKILFLCETGKIEAFVTPLIVANCYYILRQLSSHELVVNKLKTLLTTIKIIGMNSENVMDALHSEFKDFEDAMQNYSAFSNSISVIITRNTKDYKKSKLSIYNPENFLKINY